MAPFKRNKNDALLGWFHKNWRAVYNGEPLYQLFTERENDFAVLQLWHHWFRSHRRTPTQGYYNMVNMEWYYITQNWRTLCRLWAHYRDFFKRPSFKDGTRLHLVSVFWYVRYSPDMTSPLLLPYLFQLSAFLSHQFMIQCRGPDDEYENVTYSLLYISTIRGLCGT